MTTGAPATVENEPGRLEAAHRAGFGDADAINALLQWGYEHLDANTRQRFMDREHTVAGFVTNLRVIQDLRDGNVTARVGTNVHTIARGGVMHQDTAGTAAPPAGGAQPFASTREMLTAQREATARFGRWEYDDEFMARIKATPRSITTGIA